MSRLQEDYELIENEGLFQEYLEMGQYSINIVYIPVPIS